MNFKFGDVAIFGGFKLLQSRQIAKLKTLPDFPAIRYTYMYAYITYTHTHLEWHLESRLHYKGT